MLECKLRELDNELKKPNLETHIREWLTTSKNLKVARLKNVEREIKKLNDELRGFEILRGFEKHEKNECNICLVEDERSTFKCKYLKCDYYCHYDCWVKWFDICGFMQCPHCRRYY
ncbi:hypothetical protein C2G38_2050973 [Gigaspora rosea]|uniref:RING-type domain-containing protein n=1 Tax=Gigaspora rosea TaxID=44941 RepID=A0A397TT81_9GLOM|nr:hypothetical protein C2G38_2050973 [Gigaspora rosea]